MANKELARGLHFITGDLADDPETGMVLFMRELNDGLTGLEDFLGKWATNQEMTGDINNTAVLQGLKRPSSRPGQ